MAYQQLGLAKFGFKNSINTVENNTSVKRKAFKLNYEENKRIWTECFPSFADSDHSLICSICLVGETQTSNFGIKSSFIFEIYTCSQFEDNYGYPLHLVDAL